MRHGRTSCEHVHGLFNGDLPYIINNVRYRTIIMVHNSTESLENVLIWFITVFIPAEYSNVISTVWAYAAKGAMKINNIRTEGRELACSRIDLVKAQFFNRPVTRHIYWTKIQSSTQNGWMYDRHSIIRQIDVQSSGGQNFRYTGHYQYSTDYRYSIFSVLPIHYDSVIADNTVCRKLLKFRAGLSPKISVINK